VSIGRTRKMSKKRFILVETDSHRLIICPEDHGPNRFIMERRAALGAMGEVRWDIVEMSCESFFLARRLEESLKQRKKDKEDD